MKSFTRTALTIAALLPAVSLAEDRQQLKAVEMDYGIEMFECDKNLEKVTWENRHVKNQGSTYRICLRPNAKAREDGVDIQSIDSFTWETTTVQAPGFVSWDAVKDGNADNQLSMLVTHEPGKFYFLESMLPVMFYINPGAVEGYGTATMKLGSESGPVEFGDHMFKSDVTIDMSRLHLNKNIEDDIEKKMMSDL
jgi:hypothetical protein